MQQIFGSDSPDPHFGTREPAPLPFRPYRYALRCAETSRKELERDAALGKGRPPQFKVDRSLGGYRGQQVQAQTQAQALEGETATADAFSQNEPFLLHRPSDVGASVFDYQVRLGQ
ncbi:hypothetical protein HK105_200768 [Polyrhizophydium stewartii]|uniref:Uncharacterized protein n=1 Tax=Polyrhizophydium stewartii TaxID=2732419 RepID=A0ABR4NJY7_9FUNG|nr:hypothetical protein HK105_003947 [Polyrhizophydium stewartii]